MLVCHVPVSKGSRIMARSQRNTLVPAPAPAPALGASSSPTGYRPGGPVGQIQADLAHRLAPPGLVLPAVSAGERAVRLVSRAGGYLMLLAGYAGAAVLILR